jgi:hypothetical protein
MEQTNDDSGLDKYTQEKVEKGINALLEEKELKMQWRKHLEEDATIQDYFKTYHSSSVQDFITTYVNNKYHWYKHGDMYKKLADDKQAKWIELAHEHLGFILQKQLFDLQCLWRAEEIKLEGVAITYDFDYWENDIFNCHFLKSITNADVDLYQEYLLKNDIVVPRFSFSEDWQNYDEIKASYHGDEEEGQMPEWYEFHNLRTGNTKLLLLPDLRGQKEAFYCQVYFKSQQFKEEMAKNQAIMKADPNYDPDTRPFLDSFDKNILSFFIQTFEDRETQLRQKYFSEGIGLFNVVENKEYYRNLLENLLDAKEIIPIEAHYNFKEALRKAHDDFTCKKIAEHLPMAHEQYLFNKKMGFIVSKHEDFRDTIREKHIERFLNGRELNGEERNLDF